jgi:glycosyltransferase involved in cell wall biosynthesis
VISPSIALVHDYLTQRGGAERVALVLCRAFPGAPIYASLYEPAATFPEFRTVDVRVTPLNRIPWFRHRHRLALPLLAPAFSGLRVAADVVVCSSSGWAHGARIEGRKIVYCHTPARWLYQPDRYLRGRGAVQRGLAAAFRPVLARWDRAAAASADCYLANSTAVADRIRSLYGIDAEVVPPPPALTPDGPVLPVEGLDPGFVLCVSRLLPYKNVDAVVSAFARLPGERLVVAGEGPDALALRALATPNVSLLGPVDDERLRWLYRACSGLVAAAHEDFGLTPLEAATFGRPSAVLGWGGFLDTVEEGKTGVFFETPTPEAVARAVGELRTHSWEEEAIRAHAGRFSEARFVGRLREIAGVNGENS